MDMVVLTHQNITCLHHDVKEMTSPHTSPEIQAPGHTTLSVTLAPAAIRAPFPITLRSITAPSQMIASG